MTVIPMVAVMVVAAVLAMVDVMIVVMIVAKQPGADQVDHEPEGRDEDCLIEFDRHGTCQPQDAFPGNEQGDERQDDGAGEAGQVTELARAEAVARIVRVLAGIGIGHGRDQHGAGVGRHVPAVGRERHGAEDGSGDDFRQHHGRRQCDDQPDLLLVALVVAAQKGVIVTQAVDGIGHRIVLLVHWADPLPALPAGLADIGAQNGGELVHRLNPILVAAGVKDMFLKMAIDDLTDEPAKRPADRGEKLHHLPARRFRFQCPFDGLHLTLQPPHPSQQLVLFVNSVRHRLLHPIGGYPIMAEPGSKRRGSRRIAWPARRAYMMTGVQAHEGDGDEAVYRRLPLRQGSVRSQGRALPGRHLPLPRLPQASRGAVPCLGDLPGYGRPHRRRDRQLSGALLLPSLRLAGVWPQRGRSRGRWNATRPGNAMREDWGNASMLTIGALSKRTGVKVPTIRYYEQMGLLAPAGRTEGNQRRYERHDLERLAFIRHARDLGLDIPAIRELIALSEHPQHPCGDADRIAAEHLAGVRLKIEKLRKLEEELQRIVSHCDGDHAIEDCYVIRALSDHGLCENGEH
eukprot:g20091.t1